MWQRGPPARTPSIAAALTIFFAATAASTDGPLSAAPHGSVPTPRASRHVLNNVIATVDPSLPTVLITAADGSEGSAMTLALLGLRAAEHPGDPGIIAAVETLTSNVSRSLAEAGAKLRVLSSPPIGADFADVDVVFLLPPLTADRATVATTLIAAAVASPRRSGPPNILLLSVVGAGVGAGVGTVGLYAEIERNLSAVAPPSRYAVLRTAFYVENLLLWATDAQSECAVRLPLQTKCIAALVSSDVATVVFALAATRQLVLPSEQTVYNLTGPALLSGVVIGAAVGHRYVATDHNTSVAIVSRVKGVDRSEAELVVDLLSLQSERCDATPSSDVRKLAGVNAANATAYLTGVRPRFFNASCRG